MTEDESFQISSLVGPSMRAVSHDPATGATMAGVVFIFAVGARAVTPAVDP